MTHNSDDSLASRNRWHFVSFDKMLRHCRRGQWCLDVPLFFSGFCVAWWRGARIPGRGLLGAFQAGKLGVPALSVDACPALAGRWKTNCVHAIEALYRVAGFQLGLSSDGRMGRGYWSGRLGRFGLGDRRPGRR